MDEKSRNELFELCTEIYSSSRMSGLCKFIKNYEGSSEEKNYLELVEKVLSFRNARHSTIVIDLGWYKGIEELIDDGNRISEGELAKKVPLSDCPWLNISQE